MSRSADQLLDSAWAALERGEHARVRSLARRAARDKRLVAESLHLLGAIELSTGDTKTAIELLERAVDLGADYGDIYYDLGSTYRSLDDTENSVSVFLRVLDLDARIDRAQTEFLDEDRLVRAAEATLDQLPGEIVEKLVNVPIIAEERPSPDLVKQGFDPRSLGLFEGVPWSDQGLSGPALGRIVLYRANIAAYARTPEEADEQVRITLLHETAHFFGLDEDQVSRLGLG